MYLRLVSIQVAVLLFHSPRAAIKGVDQDAWFTFSEACAYASILRNKISS